MSFPFGPSYSSDIGPGECTNCGKESEGLIVVTDEDWLCAECLEEECFLCDNCQEYWFDDIGTHFGVRPIITDDGSFLCPDCADSLGIK